MTTTGGDWSDRIYRRLVRRTCARNRTAARQAARADTDARVWRGLIADPLPGLDGGGRVVRGMAATCLSTIGVEADAAAVGAHYGARSRGGLLDGWLVAEEDAAGLAGLRELGIRAEARPLLLTPGDPAGQVAADALALAAEIRR